MSFDWCDLLGGSLGRDQKRWELQQKFKRAHQTAGSAAEVGRCVGLSGEMVRVRLAQAKRFPTSPVQGYFNRPLAVLPEEYEQWVRFAEQLSDDDPALHS